LLAIETMYRHWVSVASDAMSPYQICPSDLMFCLLLVKNRTNSVGCLGR